MLDSAESYNLKATIDPLEMLRGSRDPEAVRTAIAGLIERTAHMSSIRDGKVNPDTGVVTEVPIGQGRLPGRDGRRRGDGRGLLSTVLRGVPWAPGDVFDSIREGVDFFRDLPNRLLAEAGIL